MTDTSEQYSYDAWVRPNGLPTVAYAMNSARRLMDKGPADPISGQAFLTQRDIAMAIWRDAGATVEDTLGHFKGSLQSSTAQLPQTSIDVRDMCADAHRQYGSGVIAEIVRRFREMAA